jgi:hypothetical protein
LENVIDPIGDVDEGRRRSDVVACVIGFDEREIGRSYRGGVEVQLHQRPGAHQDGCESNITRPCPTRVGTVVETSKNAISDLSSLLEVEAILICPIAVQSG